MDKKLGSFITAFVGVILTVALLMAIADQVASLSNNHNHQETFTPVYTHNHTLTYDNLVTFTSTNPSACNKTTTTVQTDTFITPSLNHNVTLTKEFADTVIYAKNLTGGETLDASNYTIYGGFPTSKFFLKEALYDGVKLNISYQYIDNLNGTIDFVVWKDPGVFNLTSNTYNNVEIECSYVYKNLTDNSSKIFLTLIPLLFALGILLFVIYKLREGGFFDFGFGGD
jgi:hypothetical protein